MSQTLRERYGERESNSFFKNLYQFIIFQLLLAWLGERRENPYTDTMSSLAPPWKELRLWLRLLWVARACLWLITGLFRVDPGRIYCVWFKATSRSIFPTSMFVKPDKKGLPHYSPPGPGLSALSSALIAGFVRPSERTSYETGIKGIKTESNN